MHTEQITEYMTRVGQQARSASRAMAKASTAARNQALLLIAAAIRRDAAKLIAANQLDLDAATAGGLAPALLDRLTLSPTAIATMADGLEQIVTLADPIGETPLPAFARGHPRATAARRCRNASPRPRCRQTGTLWASMIGDRSRMEKGIMRFTLDDNHKDKLKPKSCLWC